MGSAYSAARRARYLTPPAPGKPKCELCELRVYAKGRCINHYGRTGAPRLSLRTCSVDGCTKPHHGKGKCIKHYQRDYYRHLVVPKAEPKKPRGHWHREGDKDVLHWPPSNTEYPWVCPTCDHKIFEEDT
jgi:hypothetical protein